MSGVQTKETVKARGMVYIFVGDPEIPGRRFVAKASGTSNLRSSVRLQAHRSPFNPSRQPGPVYNRDRNEARSNFKSSGNRDL